MKRNQNIAPDRCSGNSESSTTIQEQQRVSISVTIPPAGPGVLVCSIDNMPTQLPMEATDFFGNLVYPYALDILKSDASRPIEDHDFSPAVQSAIIASNGELTPKFKYIEDLRTLHVRSHHKTGEEDEETRKVQAFLE